MQDEFQTDRLRTSGALTLQDDYVTVTDDWAFRCYAPSGSLIFCYPYYGMSGD